MSGDNSGYRFEVLGLKARTKFKQLLRYLCVGLIVFGAWTMYTMSSVAQASGLQSKLLAKIPPQTIVELGYYDGAFIVAAGLMLLGILSR